MFHFEISFYTFIEQILISANVSINNIHSQYEPSSPFTHCGAVTAGWWRRRIHQHVGNGRSVLWCVFWTCQKNIRDWILSVPSARRNGAWRPHLQRRSVLRRWKDTHGRWGIDCDSWAMRNRQFVSRECLTLHHCIEQIILQWEDKNLLLARLLYPNLLHL